MQPHANVIAQIGRDVQAHNVGLNGNLAMASIDQNRQADACRPPQVADGVQGGANRPAREQDVIHEHDLGSVDVKRDLGASQHGPPRDVFEIVAIERDVDRTDFDILPEQPLQLLSQPLGEGNPARSNAHQAKRHPGAARVGELASHRGDQTIDFVVIA